MTDHIQPGADQGIPQSPAPLAVPWTPPAQSAQATPQAYVQTPQPQMQIQPPAQSPVPQAAIPQTPNPAHYPQPYRGAPQAIAPVPQPPIVQPPAPVQAHTAYQQQAQMNPLPVHQSPQHQGYSPQAMAQPQMAPQNGAVPPAYAHPNMSHNAPVNHAPPMPVSAQAPTETHQKSKSLFANLLKRSPKTMSEPTAPKSSGSLFDKNFAFGLVAGTIIGFLVLPIIFSGGPEQATPAYAPIAENSVPNTEGVVLVETPAEFQDGEAFVDMALKQDAP